ncbi:hypothetical protein D3C80_1370340 [compost metagenome]
MASLLEQVLAEAGIGMQRIVIRAHQHQYADAVPALQPAAIHQLIHCAAQGMTIDLIAIRQLLLGRQIVATAVLGAQLLLQLRGDLLVTGGEAGRMSR